MVGIRWCVVGTARLQVIVNQLSPTLLTPSPPTTLRGSASFSYLVPYHRPVCHLAPGHTGVFHKNFLWYKLLALICIITLPFVFPLGMTFRTFMQHFFAEKCIFLCRTIILRNPFPALLLLHLPFNKFMLITYFKGIRRSFNPSGTQLLTFMREREMWEWLPTTVYNSPYLTTQIQHLKFAFVRSHRGSKKKVIEKISTRFNHSLCDLVIQISIRLMNFQYIFSQLWKV
jgi:hypothetical protein